MYISVFLVEVLVNVLVMCIGVVLTMKRVYRLDLIKVFMNYEVLLRDALEGREESFVRLPEVLASWKVWSPVVTQLDEVREDLHLCVCVTYLLIQT